MDHKEKQKLHDMKILDMAKVLRAIAAGPEGKRFREILEDIRDSRINGTSEFEIGSRLGQRDLALDFLFLMEETEDVG